MPILDNFESQYISNVSQKEHGLMSSFDKVKLDGILLEDINYINNGLQEIRDYQVAQVIYGIKIDTKEPDPNKAVTYTDDAINFTPLKVNQTTGACNYGSWKDIIDNMFGIKPFLIRNDGQILSELNPDNYNKSINGNNIDNESGEFGQVMIRFKHVYYKFLVENGKIWFRVSNKRVDHTWIDSAFTAENGIGSIRDEMYIAAYESTHKNNMLQSLSNQNPVVKLDFNLMQECSSFGVFHMMNIIRKQFIIFLGYLVTKSIDLEGNIGKGNISGSVLKTGTMNTKGLFYGRSSTTQGVKIFGIENLWGNQLKYMNGLIQRFTPVYDKEIQQQIPEQHLYIKEFYPYDNIQNFDDVGKINENIAGYISSIKFLSSTIYVPENLDGTTINYYKSFFQNGKSNKESEKLYALYGGNNTHGDKAGAEFLYLANLNPDKISATTHIIY